MPSGITIGCGLGVVFQQPARSRDPIIKYDSLSTLMSRLDVGARRAGLEHCRNIPLLPVISGREQLENRLNRLLSCVGVSKILELFCCS